MYSFRFDGIVCQQFIFLSQTLFICQLCFVFQFGKLCSYVGQYKEGRIFRVTGNQIHTFICKVYTVQFFFDDEIQRVSCFVHAFIVLLHVDFLGLQHTSLDALFTQELDQCLVFRQSFMAAEQGKKTFFLFFLIAGSNEAFGVSQILSSQFLLCFYQAFYQWTKLFKQLFFTFGDRAGNNQRSTGIVNQYGVHLIDDGIIVLTLYKVFRADSHVITQVVETEFIVRTECDICQICFATCV